MQIIQIPDGHQIVILSDNLLTVLNGLTDWQTIKEPTIKQVANYIGVSVEKIKKDLKNPKCLLRVAKKGSKGRGNETIFIKSTVELYKNNRP
ncbi:hypothetical protein KIH23_08450 [Flavobacterium sp. CYK-55]|uniref:hypothetical protein n=1 Tax=Flavobacterium sp. CYK-55 TaxID=2835529 RepID=UPI001BCD4FFE|nr:hypothetical protein [Flavobacterium sp. CYK-55]MBS7787327.1 hypothetical protein [Flavobacterium sp. CYK-55]